MKHGSKRGWPALALCAALACAHAPAQSPAQFNDSPAPDEEGRTFVEHLARGEFAEAALPFDDTLRAAAPPEKLAAAWGTFQQRFGAFGAIDAVRTERDGNHRRAFVTVRFSHDVVVVRVVMDARAHIIGFFVDSVTALNPWTAPAYADAAKFTEQPVTVGSSPPLPGHLTIPVGGGPFPIAILVQGSGPGDEDETVGDSKPFKDLAYGLASRGVAVLRFDKRTRVRPLPPPTSTVREEYFDAFGDALALVRAHSQLDPSRIVVVGHSLGAMLAPWIARDHPDVAAIALLAPPARSILDAVVDQFEQLAKVRPESKEIAAQLARARSDRDRAASPDLRPDEKIFYVTGAYWIALRDYSPLATARALGIPMFVAQGERDYNVSPEGDFAKWEAALAGRPNAVLKRYPNLNHLFIPWGGTPSVEDDGHGGHVAPQIIEDVAAWIQAIPRVPTVGPPHSHLINPIPAKVR